MTAPTARARARAEITDELLAIARRHLADGGAASLSLRAVAREAQMVSSAVYRYFPSRDDLLTRLIVDAFDAVGVAGEAADRTCERADLMGRWMAVSHAVRAWAMANPHEYALVYGTPVPGYAAPTDTVDPAARASLVLIQLLVDGVATGAIAVQDHVATTRAVRRDLAQLRSTIAPGVPDTVLSRGFLVWTQLFGAISYELFGHFHNLISDFEAFFELQTQRAGQLLLNGQV